MGIVLSKYKFKTIDSTGLYKPIVYCCDDEDISASAISVNKMIAEKLFMIKSNRRSFRLQGIVDDVIASIPANSTIKEFDVLFNPSYQVDVLQMLISACKRKSFAMIWPGSVNENRLVYAVPGMADYKQYNINEYDITCIVN